MSGIKIQYKASKTWLNKDMCTRHTILNNVTNATHVGLSNFYFVRVYVMKKSYTFMSWKRPIQEIIRGSCRNVMWCYGMNYIHAERLSIIPSKKMYSPGYTQY